MFRVKSEKEGLTPWLRLYIRYKITDFKIDDKERRFVGTYEPHMRKDWSLAIQNLLEKEIKPLPLFKELVDSISKDYKEELVARRYHPSAQVEFWLESFIRRILAEEIDGKLSEERLVDLISTFKAELQGASQESHVTVYLDGISLKMDAVQLGDNVLLRRPQPSDLEYEFEAIGPETHLRQTPSAVLELRTRAKDTDVYEKMERTITLLRLFHVSSVDYLMHTEQRKTAMWPTGTVGSFRLHMHGASHTYIVTDSDVNVLPRFFELFESRVPIKVTERRLESLHIALSRYNNALLEPVEVERKLMTAVMGLEALYTLEGERGETSFRLGLRVSRLLGQLGSQPLEARDMIEKSYKIRSRVGHGLMVRAEARKELNVVLNKILDYLRKSIILFTIGTETITKGDFVSLIDRSMISNEHLAELKGKVGEILNQVPKEVLTD